ncbi:hypothetical protein D9M69_403980 [compost metagenome]
MDDEITVALHVAGGAVAVDGVVDEIAVVVVHRQLPEFGHRRQLAEVEGQGVAVPAIEGLPVGILQAVGDGVRLVGNGAAPGDLGGASAQHVIVVVVAEAGLQLPAVHVAQGVLEGLARLLARFEETCFKGAALAVAETCGVEYHARAQADARQVAQGFQFLLRVAARGHRGIVEHQADQLQVIHRRHASGQVADLRHAREAGVASLDDWLLFQGRCLAVVLQPEREREDGHAVHDLAGGGQVRRRVFVFHSQAQRHHDGVGWRADDLGGAETGREAAVPVRTDDQILLRSVAAERTAAHEEPAGVLVHALDTPVAAVLHLGGEDHHRPFAQVEEAAGVQGRGIRRGGEALLGGE